MHESSEASPGRATVPHHPVVIVGAGLAGIGLVIRLRKAGITDLLVLERAHEVGGTWRDNTYPGCACDVASHLYSFSFAPNPDWSKAFSDRDEILAYAEELAERHDVRRDVRFGCELLAARWDETSARWQVNTSTGPLTASVLISATGPFGEPITPDIAGLERFTGKLFHSHTWDHDHDLRGERVGVVGTGASAVQFIPQIQPLAARLTVFQRTPTWVMPRFNRRMRAHERALLRRVPPLRLALRGFLYGIYESYGSFNFVDRRFRHPSEAIGRWQLRRQVRDRQLRGKLTPRYAIGCKRTVVSDDYLPSLTRSNVELITEGITEVTERGIVTADGREHELDTIILGTGFTLMRRSAESIVGADGRSLADVYRERPQSYLGVSISGFPNLLLTSGPFGGAGNQSFLFMLECQFAYIVDALQAMRRDRLAVIDVRADVQRDFVDDAEARSQETVWLRGGCSGYYTTADGKRNAGLWPNWSFVYRRRTSRFEPARYDVHGTLSPITEEA